MAGADKQKQSLYFPQDMLGEIMKEAIRLDRSISWMVQKAWRVARGEIGKFPSVDQVLAAPDLRREPQPAIAREPRRDREPRPVEADPVAGRSPSAQVREFLKGKFENT